MSPPRSASVFPSSRIRRTPVMLSKVQSRAPQQRMSVPPRSAFESECPVSQSLNDSLPNRTAYSDGADRPGSGSEVQLSNEQLTLRCPCASMLSPQEFAIVPLSNCPSWHIES